MHFSMRNAPAHRGRVGAFRDHPLRFLCYAGFREQSRKPHSGPFRTGEQAVQFARGDLHGLRRAERPAVAGALHEMDMRFHRIAHAAHRRENASGRFTIP